MPKGYWVKQKTGKWHNPILDAYRDLPHLEDPPKIEMMPPGSMSEFAEYQERYEVMRKRVLDLLCASVPHASVLPTTEL